MKTALCGLFRDVVEDQHVQRAIGSVDLGHRDSFEPSSCQGTPNSASVGAVEVLCRVWIATVTMRIADVRSRYCEDKTPRYVFRP